MDLRRRPANAFVFSDEPVKTKNLKQNSESVPYVVNAVFFDLFFSMAYFLLPRWREKIRTSTPLHFVTISDIAAIFSLIASVIYLMAFFCQHSRSGAQKILFFPEALCGRPGGTGLWAGPAQHPLFHPMWDFYLTLDTQQSPPYGYAPPQTDRIHIDLHRRWLPSTEPTA